MGGGLLPQMSCIGSEDRDCHNSTITGLGLTVHFKTSKQSLSKRFLRLSGPNRTEDALAQKHQEVVQIRRWQEEVLRLRESARWPARASRRRRNGRRRRPTRPAWTERSGAGSRCSVGGLQRIGIVVLQRRISVVLRMPVRCSGKAGQEGPQGPTRCAGPARKTGQCREEGEARQARRRGPAWRAGLARRTRPARSSWKDSGDGVHGRAGRTVRASGKYDKRNEEGCGHWAGS